MGTSRIASAAIVALALAGCAGGQSLMGEQPAPAAATPAVVMDGRWMLSAPNAPSCGMNFATSSKSPGTHEGTVAPEGGCPGRFFTSRHWLLAPGALTINDYEGTPLAKLDFAGDHFEGKSTEGLPITLARANPAVR
jgi:hypothetical protein